MKSPHEAIENDEQGKKTGEKARTGGNLCNPKPQNEIESKIVIHVRRSPNQARLERKGKEYTDKVVKRRKAASIPDVVLECEKKVVVRLGES